MASCSDLVISMFLNDIILQQLSTSIMETKYWPHLSISCCISQAKARSYLSSALCTDVKFSLTP